MGIKKCLFTLLLLFWTLNWSGSASAHQPSCNIVTPCPSGHACLVFYGECRSSPSGSAGDICGAADPCSSSNYCGSGSPPRCTARGGSGASCSGLNATQGTCLSGYNCINSVCRDGASGDACSGTLGVNGTQGTCNAGNICIGGTCRDGAAGDACIGALGVNGTQGTCNSGNICVNSVCRDGADGDDCLPDLGINNTRGTCNTNLLCRDNSCSERDEAGESCSGIGQGTCATNLICDGGTATCRNVPSREGQPCGIGVACDTDLFCDDTIGGTCQQQAASTESCNALVGNSSCEGDLVCDLFTSECRESPPVKGEVCHLTTGACASDFYCNSGRCDDRHAVDETCTGIGVGTCQTGLVCDGGTGECRNQPPIAGQPCGLGVPCESDSYCYTNICGGRVGVDQDCSGIGQGNCTAGLICDGGSGKCRDNPPTEDQPCSIFVPCADDLYCDGANGCQAVHAVGESCTGIGKGSCEDGLICDGGTGLCRNNPPTLGQACGITVPCADGLYCPFNGLCATALGEGSGCIDSSQCANDLFCDGFTCAAADSVGDACTGLFRGSCEKGLICDGGTGLCRNDPPQNGQACGFLVDCVASDYCDGGTCTTRVSTGGACSGIGKGTCQSGNLCIGGVCEAEGAVGDACTGLFRGTCQAGLYCSGNVCVNDPPAEGQNCGFLGICSRGTYCEIATGECTARKPVGETCDSSFDTSCAEGSVCGRSYEFDTDETGYRCFPDTIGRLSEEECRSLFNEDHYANAQTNNETFTISSSKSGGIFATGSYGIGVFYGESGEFGCFESTCAGLEADIFIGGSNCIGSTNMAALPGESWVTSYTAGKIAEATIEFEYAEFGGVNVQGLNKCFSVAASASPLPGSIGGYQCQTSIDLYDIDSNDDGITDMTARTLSLNSASSSGDSDEDGISDWEEMNGDVDSPPDSDGDGLIDAVEPDAAATSAQIAYGLLLENGVRVTIETASGEILSGVQLFEAIIDNLVTQAPYGMIQFTSTIPVTGEHLLRLTFDQPLATPFDLYLYQPDTTHVEIGNIHWQLINPTTIEITMSDGTSGLDNDNEMNGRFVTTLVIAPRSASGTEEETDDDEDSGGSGSVHPGLLLFALLLTGFARTRRFRSKIHEA